MAYTNRDRYEPADCNAVIEYRCPVCGEELQYDDKVFENCAGEIIGCCKCLWERDAEDAL